MNNIPMAEAGWILVQRGKSIMANFFYSSHIVTHDSRAFVCLAMEEEALSKFVYMRKGLC